VNTVRNSYRAPLQRLWLKQHRTAFSDSGKIRRPRLLVDVSVIMRNDAATGIQRVVRSVWSHLKASDQTFVDVVPVYAGPTRGYCFAPEDFLCPETKPTHLPVGVRPGDKFLGLDLTAHWLPNYSDQISAWRRHGATIHNVVYDLLPLARPDWFEKATSQHFARWFKTVTNHADQVLCISESVAQEFRRRIIGTSAHERVKVSRLHLSGDIVGSIPSVGRCERVAQTLDHVRSRPTILMIGTIEPRKGYDRALDAFDWLWTHESSAAPDLVIVGKPGWKTAPLQERIRNHRENGLRLHWLENVSDEALMELYESSRAIFHASYDEGFGLPLTEAATHRRWALVRDLPVFREQNLSNVRYFDSDAPEALGTKVLDLMGEAERGLPPAASPTPNWAWSVGKLLEELGLPHDGVVRQPPVLRMVS